MPYEIIYIIFYYMKYIITQYINNKNYNKKNLHIFILILIKLNLYIFINYN